MTKKFSEWRKPREAQTQLNEHQLSIFSLINYAHNRTLYISFLHKNFGEIPIEPGSLLISYMKYRTFTSAVLQGLYLLKRRKRFSRND